MHRLTSFTLQDMTACGAALRRLGAGATGIEDVAQRLVRHLFSSLVRLETQDPACALVRLFETHPYSQLAPDLQALAVKHLGKTPPHSSTTCLTLLGSAGVVPGWNIPALSSRYRVIPLVSPEAVEQLPMFSQLFRQFGWSLPEPNGSVPNIVLDSGGERTFGVFHVLKAEGSPFVPAQEEFVKKYGIQSVLGFGAPLPSGEMFAVILFSREIISENTAELFKTLALCAKSALLPYDDPTQVLPASRPSASHPRTAAPDAPTIGQLQSRIALLENLLAVHEQTVETQAGRLEIAVTGANLGTWDWDIPTGRVTFNQRWAEMLGYRLDEIEPHVQAWEGLLHPEDKPGVMAALSAHLEGRTAAYSTEHRLRTRSGDWRWVLDTGRVLSRDSSGAPLRAAGIHLDITVRKRLEEAQARAEEDLRQAVESLDSSQRLLRQQIAEMPIGHILCDTDFRIRSWNPAAERIFGYRAEEVMGRHASLLVPGEIQPLVDGIWNRLLAGDLSAHSTNENLTKAGQRILCEWTNTPLRDGNGRIVSVLSMVSDVTERRRMADAVQQSEERFRQLAENIDAVFWLVSADRKEMVYVSPAFEQIWGHSRTELHARPDVWLHSVHPEDRTRVETASACQGTIPYDEEYRIIRSDGSIRWIRDRCFPVKNESGSVYRFAGIAQDVTATRQMEEAIRWSEARYRSLVELSPNAVLVTVDGVIVYANQACLNLVGASAPSQLMKREFFELVPAESRPRFQARLDTIEVTGQALPPMEDRFVRLDGTVIDIEIAAAPITFEDRPAIQRVVTDVTARKNLERALVSANLQLEAILDAASQIAIIATDTDGLITTFNHGAEAMLGYAADEMIGKRTPLMFHDSAEVGARARMLSALYERPVHGFEVFVENARHGGYDEGEWTYIRKDGTRLIVILTVTALRNPDGKAIGYLGVAKDITQRKESEVALARAASELEQKNRELAQARDEALDAAKLKSEFLATMSNEIRTPMNAIIGMTGLLLDTALTEEQREFADTVRRSSDALLTLVNDILDFSKMEAGKLHFENLAFDLRTTVEDTLELLAEQAQGKGLELIGSVDAAVPAGVYGDPGRLRQVLVNLVGNAIKFTAAGQVFLHVTRDQADNPNRLRFTVTDTGIGIPKEATDRLFQAFIQADSSTTRRYGGTGLGLAICKRLVTQMHGQIGVDSVMGQGSSFWFTAELPETAIASAPPAASWARLRGRRVLLVDPNRTVRRVLQEQVISDGMECTSAETGAEAIAMARAAASQQPFDFALIELHQSDMDGFEVARRLKQDPAVSAIRTIILATVGRRGDGATAKELGIDGYLTKPLRHSQLLDCLSLTLETHGQASGPRQAPLITKHRLAEAEASSQARLLLAEDNPVNQKVAIKMLEKLGYRVDVAANGQEAVAAHQRSPYSLIFMDCQMPEMDGFEATALIRKMEGRSVRTPIIAMTANAMQGDRERCLAAGMDDYVAKPIRSKDLQTVIETWLLKRPHTANA